MKQLVYLASLSLFIGLQACNKKGNKFDASGTFETDEVIVSSELGGKILSLQIEEGQEIAKDSIAGMVDATNLSLQEQQVEASINALNQKTADVNPQVKFLRNQLAVQQSQLNNLTHERARIANLIKADAATGKQLDDINAQIDVAVRNMAVTTQQINVQQSNIATQNRSILSEAEPLRKGRRKSRTRREGPIF